jgi:hypothetical protein
MPHSDLRDSASLPIDGTAPVGSHRVGVDHVFLTRFNLPSVGPESLIRAQQGWLQERVELFEKYTVPSVVAQTAAEFSWLVFLDTQSPGWLLDRLAPLIDGGVFTPVYGEEFTRDEIVAHAREASGGRHEMLLTTNLDNDDALAVDFAERLQGLVIAGQTRALYLGNGLILHGSETYLRRDPANAFVSVAEPWDGAGTVWREWHNLLHTLMPTHSDGGAPGWLQVVHGRNVSNRVRGVLTDPTRFRHLFPGLLDGIKPPTGAALLRDRAVQLPLRSARESARRIAKKALLTAVGKGGLDRIKESVGRRRAAR